MKHMALMVAIVGLLVAIFWGVHNLPDYRADAAARALENAVAVSAYELSSSFKQNEVAALQQYPGPLKVSGTVKSIQSDYNGSPFVVLEGDDDESAIRATFDAGHANRLAELAPGTSITVGCADLTEGAWGLELVRCTAILD